jgi:hypothetical protein
MQTFDDLHDIAGRSCVLDFCANGGNGDDGIWPEFAAVILPQVLGVECWLRLLAPCVLMG